MSEQQQEALWCVNNQDPREAWEALKAQASRSGMSLDELRELIEEERMYQITDPDKELTIDWKSIGRGMYLVMAWHDYFAVPVGHVYVRLFGENEVSGKTRVEVYGSYVHPTVRRQGVRTWLQKQLFIHFKPDVITTQSGTEMSSPWMEKVGYVVDALTGVWVCTREAFEAKMETSSS